MEEKQNMKKILSLVIATLMILTVCGCVEEPPLPAESTPEVSQSESMSESVSEAEPKDTDPHPSETEPEGTEPGESESPTETTEEPDTPIVSEPLKVMSYNVYTTDPNRLRVEKVVNNIKSFDPDVIGVQELNYAWISLLNRTTDMFDTYEMVGEPRQHPSDKSNGNEYSAIFYKKDKFNLIETDTYWLSDTPDKISKFDGTEYYRIMTYAVLERRSDGEKFIHVNTHLAYDKATRNKQVPVLLSLADELLKKHGNLPIFFTGDFNMSKKAATYSVMLDWNLDDTRYLFDPANTEDTHQVDGIIDYCFVSKDDFDVITFDVGFGLEGSDHYPVYVEMYIK